MNAWSCRRRCLFTNIGHTQGYPVPASRHSTRGLFKNNMNHYVSNEYADIHLI